MWGLHGVENSWIFDKPLIFRICHKNGPPNRYMAPYSCIYDIARAQHHVYSTHTPRAHHHENTTSTRTPRTHHHEHSVSNPPRQQNEHTTTTTTTRSHHHGHNNTSTPSRTQQHGHSNTITTGGSFWCSMLKLV